MHLGILLLTLLFVGLLGLLLKVFVLQLLKVLVDVAEVGDDCRHLLGSILKLLLEKLDLLLILLSCLVLLLLNEVLGCFSALGLTRGLGGKHFADGLKVHGLLLIS